MAIAPATTAPFVYGEGSYFPNAPGDPMAAAAGPDMSGGLSAALQTPGFQYMGQPSAYAGTPGVDVSKWNPQGYYDIPNIGSDPNTRFIYSDLLNAGLTPDQIQKYGATATTSLGGTTSPNWATDYGAVLSALSGDYPGIAKSLALTPAQMQSGAAWGGAMGAQTSQIGGGAFDKFMANYAPWLMVGAFGGGVGAGIAGAGAGAGGGAGGAATAAELYGGADIGAGVSADLAAGGAAAGGGAATAAELYGGSDIGAGVSSDLAAGGTAAPVTDLSRAYRGQDILPNLSNLATYMTGSPTVGDIFQTGNTLGGVGALGGGNVNSYLSLGSGLYGLYLSEQQRKLAQQAAQMQDPFGPQRGQYQAQLSALMADPSSITRIPGYQAGIQAVNRGMAAGGYLGSGNQMTALQKFGGDFYNQQLSLLSGLAGANISPSGGPMLLQGTQQANALASSALGSIGYGAMSPQLMAMLAMNRGY